MFMIESCFIILKKNRLSIKRAAKNPLLVLLKRRAKVREREAVSRIKKIIIFLPKDKFIEKIDS